ncbi:MAG: CHAT domain-containing protein [Saprospiraceae bacterium]|nr:CHAT domain-containing protein [Saprospiraceae bacterium]
MRSIFLHTALLGLLLIASGQQNAGNPGDRLLQEGRLLFDSARYPDAQNRATAALEFFRKSAQQDAVKSGEALLLLGDVFLELGEFEAAADQFQSALRIFEKERNVLLEAKALNSLGEFWFKKSDFSKAETYYRRALALREQKLDPINGEIANSYNNIGNCFASTGRYAEALNLHQKALEIRQQVLPAGHATLAVSHSNIATCLYLIGDYAGALPQFEAAINIRSKMLGADHPKMAPLYNNLGNCYDELGRTDLALECYRRSLAIRKAHFNPDHPSIASVLENLGDLSVGRGDYLAALDYYREAYAIQSKVQGPQSLAVAALLHRIGLCFQYREDYVQALQYHLNAAGIFRNELGAEHPRLAELYSNVGNCYADKKEPEQATTYYRKSLDIFYKAYPEGHPAIVQAYNNLGSVFLEQENYHEALNLFQQAEKMLLQLPVSQEGDTKLAILIKNAALALAGLGRWKQALADCERARNSLRGADLITELELLSGEAILLKKYAHFSGDWSVLRSAARVFTRALDRLDSLRLQMSSSDTRLQWITRKYAIFGEAIEANFTLWEKTGETTFLETAFSIAEHGKSLQLVENLRKEQAERFAGIPDSLLAKERAIGLEINRLEKLRAYWIQQESREKVQEIEAALAGERRSLAALVASFETKFPEYFRLKYSRKTATPGSIRKGFLHADQAMTAYFATDSFLLAFLITRETFNGVRIPLDFPLSNWVVDMRSSIQSYPMANSEEADSLSNAYVEAATRLYQKIVAPLEAAGLAGHPHWTIIPDRELAFLPFEALLRKKPEAAHRFKSHAYLLRDYSISYAYSATQLGDLMAHTYQRPSKIMAAFAPEFRGNDYGLTALQHNRREARSVGALFDGDILEGAAASVEAFRRDAGKYRMLLLATHGKASSTYDKPSYLVFSPNKNTAFELIVRDLYEMHLPAELVVLSACETNLGEHKEGEGVVSLAKGFFHAGVRSMVATLWSVDDARNADLMLQFFQQIRKEKPKDDALKQAKLNYLKARPHDEAHPFFWAAAVATGDMTPMDFRSPWRWLLYGTGMLIAGVVVWWKRSYFLVKKRHQKKQR